MPDTEHSDVHIEDHGHEDEGGFDPSELAATAAEIVTEQARAHPYRTVAAAFGLGYVLGGGVPRFVVRLVGIAILRSAGEALIQSGAAADLVDRALHRRRSGPRPNGHSRGRFVS